MASFDRILLAYKRGLEQLARDIESGVDPSPEEQDHLRLLHELLQSVVQTYASFQLDRRSSLESSTSVMYAASHTGEEGPLNVSLASLVEARSLTDWQSRFLQRAVGMKRSLLITGPKGSGKATLLNALVRALRVDERVVAVETPWEIAGLRERAFTTRLSANTDDGFFQSALEKAGGMRPDWLLVADLAPSDGPSFLLSAMSAVAWLAVVTTDDPDGLIQEWAADEETARGLEKVAPFMVHMTRSSDGRPTVGHIAEVKPADGGLHLQQKNQG